MLVADGPPTLITGMTRFGALTDLTQAGYAHKRGSSSGNFNLWREAYAARATNEFVIRSGIVVGLGAVFAGLTVFTTVLGFVYSPVALALAVPFGAVTYFLWYHVSGRLRKRVYRQTRTAGSRRTDRTTRTDRTRRTDQTTRTDRTETGGFGAGPRREWTGPRSDGGFDAGGRRRATAGGQRQRRGPSTAEAYRALDLKPGASEAAVRSAYREKVKEVHPDTDDGSERAFKRVQSAYDHLSD